MPPLCRSTQGAAIVAFYEGRATHQSFLVMAEPVANWKAAHSAFKSVQPLELDELVDQVGSVMQPNAPAGQARLSKHEAHAWPQRQQDARMWP